MFFDNMDFNIITSPFLIRVDADISIVNIEGKSDLSNCFLNDIFRLKTIVTEPNVI